MSNISGDQDQVLDLEELVREVIDESVVFVLTAEVMDRKTKREDMLIKLWWRSFSIDFEEKELDFSDDLKESIVAFGV